MVLGRPRLLGRLRRHLDPVMAVGAVIALDLAISLALTVLMLSIILSNGRTWGP